MFETLEYVYKRSVKVPRIASKSFYSLDSLELGLSDYLEHFGSYSRL